jgi:probable O-glycosylation ligase (exosortase A-associated)
MRTIVILVVIAIGFAGAVFSRQLGLLFYVWFSLFRPLEWIWTDLTSYRLSLIAGLLFLVPCILTGKLPNVTHPLSLLCWAFLGTVVAAQATSYLASDWSWVDQFVRLLLISSIAVTLVKTREHLSQLVAVTAGSLAFFSAKAGLSALFSDGVQFGDGQAGAFVDNNGYALAINMTMPMMAAAAVTLRGSAPGLAYLRKGFIAAIPLSVVTIISTMSRAGLLALGTLVIVASLLQRRPMVWLSGLTLTGALTFAIVPLPSGYLERMQTITTYENDESASGRLHFWRIAWVMVQDNPWGVGLRRYDTAYDDYDDSRGAYGLSRSVHNSHLEVLAEMGYLGLVVWVLVFAYAFRVCMRIRYSAATSGGLSDEDRRYYMAMSTAFAASMMAFVVGGAFIAAANNDLTWLTFAMIAALDRIYRAHLRSLQSPVESAVTVGPRPRRAAIA